MALNKLPCEYKELHAKRVDDCFGDLSEKEKQHLIKVMEDFANHFEKIKYENLNNPHAIKKHEVKGGEK